MFWALRARGFTRWIYRVTVQPTANSLSPSGYSSATTSGGENDREDLEPEWRPPDEELIRKLVDQIEFYFSDENLEKDAFLLKHVRRNKLGYVSVKLLTSFKKVRLTSQRPLGGGASRGCGLLICTPTPYHRLPA
jgi:hypothetical protein